MSIEENQKKYELLREGYFNEMKQFSSLLETDLSEKEIEDNLTNLHHIAVVFFRASAKILDNAKVSEVDEAPELTNSLADNALLDSDTIINFWKFYKKTCNNRGYRYTPPSQNSYKTFQRVIKKYFPNNADEMKKKFEESGIPTTGFSDSGEHSEWKKPKNKTYLIVLIIVAILLVGAASSFPYMNKIGLISEAGSVFVNGFFTLLSLFCAIVLFGFLNSTGMVKTKVYTFSGAASIFLIILNLFIWRNKDQTFKITGQVNFENKPIARLKIAIPQIEKTDYTNEHGIFTISAHRTELIDSVRVLITNEDNNIDTVIIYDIIALQNQLIIDLK